MPSFVDTNILVYAEDRDAKSKHDIARELVLGLWNDRQGVLSIQVLQEFYVAVTRKLKKPLRAAEALDAVREYLTWRVVENTGTLLVEAASSSSVRNCLSGTRWWRRPRFRADALARTPKT